MGLAYKADFMACRPWGNKGDRKNDGFLESQRRLFLVYAPNDMTSKDAILAYEEASSSESLLLSRTGYAERGRTSKICGKASVKSRSQAWVYVLDLRSCGPRPSVWWPQLAHGLRGLRFCTDLHTRASLLYAFVRINKNTSRRNAFTRFFLGKVAKFLAFSNPVGVAISSTSLRRACVGETKSSHSGFRRGFCTTARRRNFKWSYARMPMGHVGTEGRVPKHGRNLDSIVGAAKNEKPGSIANGMPIHDAGDPPQRRRRSELPAQYVKY